MKARPTEDNFDMESYIGCQEFIDSINKYADDKESENKGLLLALENQSKSLNAEIKELKDKAFTMAVEKNHEINKLKAKNKQLQSLVDENIGY